MIVINIPTPITNKMKTNIDLLLSLTKDIIGSNIPSKNGRNSEPKTKTSNNIL